MYDELHLDQHATDATREMMNALNLSSSRSLGLQIRMDRDRQGNMVPNVYRMWGPKLFAGYGSDEKTGIARRTVSIRMANTKPTPAQIRLRVPPEMEAQAAVLRARLLDWKARMAAEPLGDEALARTVSDRAGGAIGQHLFALFGAVPPSAHEALFAYVAERRAALYEAEAQSEEAVYARAVRDAARALHVGGDAVVVIVTAAAVHAQLRAAGNIGPSVSESAVGKKLGTILRTKSRRFGKSKLRAFQLDVPEVLQALVDARADLPAENPEDWIAQVRGRPPLEVQPNAAQVAAKIQARREAAGEPDRAPI